jgi:hypothetical protein
MIIYEDGRSKKNALPVEYQDFTSGTTKPISKKEI